MAQATPKKSRGAARQVSMTGHLREGAAVLFAALAIYLLMALISFNPLDPGWSHTGEGRTVTNLGGVAGAWFADVFFFLVGYLAYLAPVMVALSGWLVVRRQGDDGGVDYRALAVRWAGFFVTVAAGCGLATLHFSSGGLPMGAGGLVGALVGEGLVPAFSFVGTTLVLLAFFLAGVTLFTGMSWLWLADQAGGWVLKLADLGLELLRELKERQAGRQARGERKAAVRAEKSKPPRRKPRRVEPRLKKEEKPVQREKVEQQIPLFDAPGETELPPLSLLDSPRESAGGYSDSALEAMSRQVELKLQDFGIEVEVVEVHPGPVITRFEVQPAAGVKASRITNLSKDLARSLSVTSVRVVEVIPGKSVVGLEIPNENREIVTLREILDTGRYADSRSALTLALGKDIAGRPVVADLARMPHLLVAGTTGSGKSVAINAMLLSLLYKATPGQIRLILIDPKMLELSVYEGVPQLLTPVVTDMKEAANALRWSVAEMERRYKLMSVLGVRNITGYNKKVTQAAAAGEPIVDPLYNPVEALDPEAPPPELATLPLIVIVVDEFADMMMVVGKKVEELIARLAQKARAAGIHLVLATQRPSVDVITGLIKANIPTRIAFQVSSRVDSRTILDQMGAEQLLGHGDMLYLPPGTALPERVHGAFVDDHEVHRVVSFLKGLGEPDYIDEVLQAPVPGSSDAIPGLEPADGEAESDPLYDQAVAIVTETRKASISYVQRRLKVGYNRAARMIEDMEMAGVVSPVQANGGREVISPPPVAE